MDGDWLRCPPGLLLVAALFFVPGGCKQGPADDDDSTSPDPVCDQGFVQDSELPEAFLEEFPDGCVPEECAVGRWGGLTVDADTVYVDASGPDVGDGSEEAPYRVIQEGLDAAGEGGSGTVVVAAGTYVENLLLTGDHDGVHLAGRCRGLVMLDASGGEEDESGIRADGGVFSTEEWTVSGVTVAGAPQGGIWLTGGSLFVLATSLAQNRFLGALAVGDSSDIFMDDVGIFDTKPSQSGTYGRGIEVEHGAHLEASSCVVERNTEVGIFATNGGTVVVLGNVEVRDTQPLPNGTSGRGISVQAGARLEASSCVADGNAEAGIYAGEAGTEVVLQEVEVRNTVPRTNGTEGMGIVVEAGARLEASSCVVAGNTKTGILAAQQGTEVVLDDVEVRDTRPTPDGRFGRGIEMVLGARLEASSCAVEGNADIGIFASEEGTEVTLLDSHIDGTRRPWGTEQTVAAGLATERRATVDATGVTITGTDGPGAMASQSTLSCEACAFENNTFAGAVVWAGGGLELSGSTISANLPDVELGGGAGVFASNRAGAISLVLVDSEVLAHDHSAVWMDSGWPYDDGSFTLTGNTLSGGEGHPLSPTVHVHGDAVFATGVSSWDGQRGLRLEDNTFRDSAGAGVFLDGSGAVLTSNAYAGNAVDLWQQDCDGVPLPVGVEEVPIAVLCPEYDRITAPLEFHLVLEEELTRNSAGPVTGLPMVFTALEPLPSL